MNSNVSAQAHRTQDYPARAVLRDYFRITKPRVVALIMFTAIVGMFLATSQLPDLSSLLLATFGIGLAAAAGAAVNHILDEDKDSLMKRTRNRPASIGAPAGIDASIGFRLFASSIVNVGSYDWRKSTYCDAYLCVVDRICSDLYDLPETRHTSKYCHRGCRGGDASGSWLDCHDRGTSFQCVSFVPDHLLLDTATFLGIGPVSSQGLSKREDTNAASNPRAEIHSLAHFAVHDSLGGGYNYAFCSRHVWALLSRRCDCA